MNFSPSFLDWSKSESRTDNEKYGKLIFTYIMQNMKNIVNKKYALNKKCKVYLEKCNNFVKASR